MNYEKLKSILFKSNIKVLIIAIILLGIGVTIALYPLFNEKSNIIVITIFGGIFLLLGLLLTYKTASWLSQVKSDKFPLLKAIKENQKDYVVWIYRKQINTTAGNDGPTLGSSQNLLVYPKEGKMIEIVLSKKDSTDDIMEYLANEFNIPYIGFTDDNKEAVEKLLGKKI